MKIVTKAKGTIDFKKKTVKVGKKLKPANETKISVKSKTIYIANHGEEKGSLSFQSQLEKQLQFLTHHASKTREVAIENISQMVEKGQVLDTYVPILITSVMDVLQDEEPKVRSAILALFSTLCVMFSRDVFAACSGIIVTYVCSGLTSLNKRIRKDSLQLLKVFCTHHFMEIFESFHIKLLALLQKLLTESMVGLNFSSTDCNDVTGNVAKTAISKLSSSHIDRLPTPNAQNRNNNAIAPIRATAVKNLKAEAQVRANKKAPPTVTMFVLLLQVIREIVVCGGKGVSSVVKRKVEYAAAVDDTESSFLLLRVNAHSGGSLAAEGMLTEGKGTTCHLTDLTASLVLLWEAVVSGEQLLTNDSINCLLELSGVLHAVAEQCAVDKTAHAGVSEELRRLLAQIMCARDENVRQFPYGSQVVSVSCAGSPEHSQSTKLVDQLNMSVCRLVACMSSETRDVSEAINPTLMESLQTTQLFEVELLQEYVAALREGLITSGGVTLLTPHAVNMLIDRHAALVPAALRDTEQGLTHLLSRQGAGVEDDCEGLSTNTIRMVTSLFDMIQTTVTAIDGNRNTASEFRNRAHNRTLVRELKNLLRSSVLTVCVLAQHVVENQPFQFTVCEVEDGERRRTPYSPVVLELFGSIVQSLLHAANILLVNNGEEGESSGAASRGLATLAVVICKTLITIIQATKWSLLNLCEGSGQGESQPVKTLFKNASTIINSIFGCGEGPSELLVNIWKLKDIADSAATDRVHFVLADLWFYSHFLLNTPRSLPELVAMLPNGDAGSALTANMRTYIEKFELYVTV